MRGVLRKQVVRAGILAALGVAGRGELLVGDHLAKVGDVLFDSGDLFRPGTQALVRDTGSVLSFGFGEGFEGVLQLLSKRGAGHRGRVSLAHLRECVFMVMGVTRVSDGVPLIAL
jgi:hypothetical protein